METKNVKSIYLSPQITNVGAIETEHPFMAKSIIPDNQEVVIQEQDRGVDEDFSLEGWG